MTHVDWRLIPQLPPIRTGLEKVFRGRVRIAQILIASRILNRPFVQSVEVSALSLLADTRLRVSHIVLRVDAAREARRVVGVTHGILAQHIQALCQMLKLGALRPACVRLEHRLQEPALVRRG